MCVPPIRSFSHSRAITVPNSGLVAAKIEASVAERVRDAKPVSTNGTAQFVRPTSKIGFQFVRITHIPPCRMNIGVRNSAAPAERMAASETAPKSSETILVSK
jgi:hypothetical protein